MKSAYYVFNEYKKDGIFDSTYCKATEKILEEGSNKLKLDKLNSLIEQIKYSASKELYEELLEKGLIEKEQEKDFIKKMEENSLEKLLEKSKFAVGREKIDIIKNIQENYPSYKNLQDLRVERLDTYLSTLESYFNTGANPKASLNLLEEFKTFLINSDKYLIKRTDFSDFLNDCQKYINSQKDYDIYSIETGDSVRIIRSLGKLGGKTEDEYFHGGNVGETPVGSRGIVINMDPDPDVIGVKTNKNSGTIGLTPGEIEKIFNDSDKSKMYLQLESIRNYLNNLKEEK